MSTQFGDMLVYLGQNDAGIVAAIPGKIHADKIPETEPASPWAYFTMADISPPQSLSGAVAAKAEFCTASLTIKAETMALKKAAMDAIKTKFAALGQGPVSINGTRFAALRVNSRSSSEEAMGDGNDNSLRGWDCQISGWVSLT